MNPYEARYRQLLANGASAWAGDGFARAKIQQEKYFIGWMPMAIYPLPARRYLNWDVAMVPWQPSIWRKEAMPYQVLMCPKRRSAGRKTVFSKRVWTPHFRRQRLSSFSM